LTWTVTDAAGKELRSGTKKTETPVNGNQKVETLELQKLIDTHTPHDLLVWLELEVEGEPRQRNMVLFSRPKHLALEKDPGIQCVVRDTRDGSFEVALAAKHPALWAWLELSGLDADVSDNFFHLRPGMSKTVRVTPAEKLSPERFRQILKVRSLVDTFIVK
jgi:beta-mannosidase